MNNSSQKDLFETPKPAVLSAPIIIELKGLQAPRAMQKKGEPELKSPRRPNFHIPSFKNAKRWVTKLPNGKPLRRPLLITSPEFQKWMEKAIRVFVSGFVSSFPATNAATPTEPSRPSLIAWLKRLRGFDDSVAWIREIHLIVEDIAPGEEGAVVTLEEIA